ncbi:hypothetical protein NECAME_09339 [Necator americanus]|uniref:Uncharacterized protein n=1 Tax=Necator americanus TaxID=51031 RepID=W2TEA9_NECAM|nr:hypothetical protein NECAME_09339 [Necator americanus]ETN80173.1 hypothetical protein NECAME_09339 [Necator americanus]
MFNHQGEIEGYEIERMSDIAELGKSRNTGDVNKIVESVVPFHRSKHQCIGVITHQNGGVDRAKSVTYFLACRHKYQTIEGRCHGDEHTQCLCSQTCNVTKREHCDLFAIVSSTPMTYHQDHVNSAARRFKPGEESGQNSVTAELLNDENMMTNMTMDEYNDWN